MIKYKEILPEFCPLFVITFCLLLKIGTLSLLSNATFLKSQLIKVLPDKHEINKFSIPLLWLFSQQFGRKILFDKIEASSPYKKAFSYEYISSHCPPHTGFHIHSIGNIKQVNIMIMKLIIDEYYEVVVSTSSRPCFPPFLVIFKEQVLDFS